MKALYCHLFRYFYWFPFKLILSECKIISTEHPELYKERGAESSSQEPKPNESGADAAGRRQAATDEFMLERFRKRERHRVMRR